MALQPDNSFHSAIGVDSEECMMLSPSVTVDTVSSDNLTKSADRCCGYNYRIQCIQSKGAFLVLLWAFFVHVFMPYNTSVHLVKVSLNSVSNNYNFSSHFSQNIYHFLFIFFPIMGWIADAKIGRYKAICYSTLIIIIAAVLFVVGYVIHAVVPHDQVNFGIKLVVMLLIGLGIFFNIIGYACFDANVIPFLTDQALGYSGEKLSALIHWHFWFAGLAELINNVLNKTTAVYNNHYLTLSVLLLHLLTVVSVVASYHFLPRWLDTTPQITNPIKLILSVLKCALKRSTNSKRSALTYWEDTIPSQIDLCKTKYGGNFTEEEVEDVKTTLRLLPLIFLSVGFGMLWNPVNYIDVFHHPIENEVEILGVQILGDIGVQNAFFTVVLIIVFHLLIYPLFYNYIPTILKRIGFGLFLIALSLLYTTVLDPIAQAKTNGTCTCVLANITFSQQSTVNVYSLGFYWVVPYISLGALGQFCIVPFAVEFIVAQTPCQMKGMMVGLWFAFYGLLQLFSYIIYYPFQMISDDNNFSCIFYYFLVKAIVCVIIFILFVYYVTRHYKLRTRDLPINFHLLAENHFNKYLSINSSKQDVIRTISQGDNSDSSSCSSCEDC